MAVSAYVGDIFWGSCGGKEVGWDWLLIQMRRGGEEKKLDAMGCKEKKRELQNKEKNWKKIISFILFLLSNLSLYLI